MKGISSLIEYIKDSKTELKKVTWPTRQETIKHTLMVIGVSLGVAAFLGIVDYILSTIFESFVLK
ncbi:preprotein translocase subunit SecE [Patescibacteria group bacterium]|nr:preprotein translocase subunit SecE [Patescibacteria group bacterium]MBU4512846.1 preprotein translocase subunit SecE [Patescibacteria group bacterium]MCG2693621.1 preprotein translocase subunit SecE [Candidatus Parcubacteria bacterium]